MLYHFILILCLFFLVYILYCYFCKKKQNISESFITNPILDAVFITNTLNDNVIVITSTSLNMSDTSGINQSQLFIYMMSSTKPLSYFSVLKFNLNALNDIFDVESGTGCYYYYNFGSGDGIIGCNDSTTGSSSCTNNSSNPWGPIDLSSIPNSKIFENAIFFENGTMISFDTTGTQLIFTNTPTPIQNNSSPNAQIIFSLAEPLSELYNNNFVFLNLQSSGIKNAPGNYYYFNGSCGNCSSGISNLNGTQIINPLETLGIFSPSSSTQSILQFSNGIFIDGSLTTSSLNTKTPPNFVRFVGLTAVIHFNLSSSGTDLVQFWNIPTAIYFNYSTTNGSSNENQLKYNISSNNLNYIDLKKNNLLPYTSSIQSTINSNNSIQYFYVDQLIIYNPNSTNNLAILIQVDSVLYIKNMGGTIPVGKNNYALTISSILFNPSTNTITSNKNSISKVALNFNAQSSSIFEFIVNNGGNSNNTIIYYQGFDNNYGSVLSKNASKPSSFNGTPATYPVSLTTNPNNLPNNSSTSNLSSNYAFRNNSLPNQLIFKNTINFEGGIQIGIDTKGNCICKGNKGQLEFCIAEQNNGKNFNFFGISDNQFDNSVNSWAFDGTSLFGDPITTYDSPSTLVSSSTTNNINDNNVTNPISTICFSNGMSLSSNEGQLCFVGLCASFTSTLTTNATSNQNILANFVKKNMQKGPANQATINYNLVLPYNGYNGVIHWINSFDLCTSTPPSGYPTGTFPSNPSWVSQNENETMKSITSGGLVQSTTSSNETKTYFVGPPVDFYLTTISNFTGGACNFIPSSPNVKSFTFNSVVTSIPNGNLNGYYNYENVSGGEPICLITPFNNFSLLPQDSTYNNIEYAPTGSLFMTSI